jgi:molybdate transport system substrate-binding protein
MPVKSLIHIALLLGLVTACTAAVGFQFATRPEEISPRTLTVFAAASLTESFTEIGQRFEAENPGVRVTFNFAGSQQLAGQIAQGAPGDVFASADRKQMQAAFDTGRVLEQHSYRFAANRLVVIYPAHNPAGLNRLQDLARPGVQVVLADAAVPAGNYTRLFLEKARGDPDFGVAFSAGVLENVVSFEENVRSVLSKVLLGEADAGIVYASDLDGVKAEDLGTLHIPDHLNVISEYFIAALGDSSRAETAKAFVDFVLAPGGQEIMEQHGFLPAVEQP